MGATRVDIDTLKRSASLSLVVQRYLGAPMRTTGHGSWWRCPFHTEKSASFLVGGRADREQEYHCFGCGAHGDVIEFVRLQEKLGSTGRDFVTVLERVAAMAGMVIPTGLEQAPTRERQVRRCAPTSTWQSAAMAFIARAQASLWGQAGRGCLRYLREQRGLSDETIREWGLGWNPATGKEPQSRWGLEREKPVWLPQGLVIPGIVDEVVWYVKIRPSAEVRRYFQGKYYQLPMADCERTALLGADRWRAGLPVLLAEGEMDALTIWQEGRELVNVATFGGAGKGRAGDRLNFGRWLLRLTAAERILVAYDADTAGQNAEAAFVRISSRFEPVQVPWGSDVNEYHVQGGDVAGWLRSVLDVTPEPPARIVEMASGYPVTLIFESRPGLALPAGRWKRLDDGRIEAVFVDAVELATVLDVAKAIGGSEG